jgi:uncharacterized repeat protein (TIGR03803 family)
MKNEEFVLSTIAYCQRLKSFRTNAALVLTTLMLAVAATTGATAQTTFTTLHSFDGTDGSEPDAGLVRATNGYLYGNTVGGGTNGYGTVFQITTSGTLKTLHSFDDTDGYEPRSGLVQATDGNLYGTTVYGGTNGYGTVFQITTSGTLKTLHSFDGTDGSAPYAALVQGTNGYLYGTTEAGGTYGYGTVFQITTSGTLKTLHSFCATLVNGHCADGAYPYYTPLVQATNGYLYGTTEAGGPNGDGTVFQITTSGTLNTLHSFDGTDGSELYAGLVQDTNGEFYGTTSTGGTDNLGTVFSLSVVGLGPFVETQTTSGKEGAKIGILGQGFSSSSVVKFGGTHATTITLTGTTFISATVPAEALTGSVTVTTGTTTLTSTKTFDVLPTITSFTPDSGPVGTSVTITGTGLEQTTKVTFDGKSATFTVISDTEVTADVPTGAATGKIGVTTKGGSATSTTSFTVN